MTKHTKHTKGNSFIPNIGNSIVEPKSKRPNPSKGLKRAVATMTKPLKVLNQISGDDVKVALPLFQEERGGAVPTSPHQLFIKEISAKSACTANARWHSRLPVIDWSNVVRNTHYVCYGAFFDNKVYAISIWSSPVAQNRFTNGKQILELRRMAIAPDAPINTASRMIAVMIRLIKQKFPDIIRLISYQDTEVHKGTIYKASGWKPVKETDFISWGNRKRNPDQSRAKKVRWERLL